MSWNGAKDFLERAAARLRPLDCMDSEGTASDYDLSGGWQGRDLSAPVRPAAVLVGLMAREDDFGVVLTLRPSTMRVHAGQVAFPGGRLDGDDPTLLAAALREADEEIGLPPSDARILGRGDDYVTGTGFVVSPFVALLPDAFVPRPDPREVADVFETPLSFLMTPENHELHHRETASGLRAYYAMPHNGRYIWGATAGMIRSLYNRLYDDG